MNIEELTPEQQKELDNWFFENPYCTHAAWLNMIAKIKNKYDEPKDDGFFDSLANKVMLNDKGITETYYVFGEKTNDCYIVNTFSFEIVRGTLMAYRASCIEVTPDDTDIFRNMQESSKQEIKDLVKNSTNILISKFND